LDGRAQIAAPVVRPAVGGAYRPGQPTIRTQKSLVAEAASFIWCHSLDRDKDSFGPRLRALGSLSNAAKRTWKGLWWTMLLTVARYCIIWWIFLMNYAVPVRGVLGLRGRYSGAMLCSFLVLVVRVFTPGSPTLTPSFLYVRLGPQWKVYTWYGLHDDLIYNIYTG